MKFYSSKIAVSKPISLEQAAAKAKQQPQVRSLDEIIASTKQIKAAAANATVKTAAVQVKVAQEFAEAPAEPINPDPIVDAPPAAPVPAPVAPMGAAPVAPGIPPAPITAPITAPNDPAGAPLPPEMNVPPAPPIGSAAPAPMGGPIPAPKATPAPLPLNSDPLAADPLAAAAASKGQLKMAKSINFTAWPEEEKVISHWKNFGSQEKCIAGVKGKTTNAAAYCTLLEKAASMASEQLVKKAAAAKSVKEAGKADQSPAFKRFAKLTEKEQSFLRDFFSKIYGKEYVTALLGDY